MKFKIGDKVRIKDKVIFNEMLKTSGLLYTIADTIREMREYAGQEATIIDIDADGYILDLGKENILWGEYDIEKLEEK